MIIIIVAIVIVIESSVTADIIFVIFVDVVAVYHNRCNNQLHHNYCIINSPVSRMVMIIAIL